MENELIPSVLDCHRARSAPGTANGIGFAGREAMIITQILLARISMMKAKYARIAVYGAGTHTRWLFSILRAAGVYPDNMPTVTTVMDDRAEHCAPVEGMAVVRPRDINQEAFDAVILSSDCFQSDMRARLDKLFSNAEFAVEDLYESLPSGPYPKLRADELFGQCRAAGIKSPGRESVMIGWVVVERLRQIKKRHPRIALYGNGVHTTWLMALMANARRNVSDFPVVTAIIDDFPERCAHLTGLNTLSAVDARKDDFDAVLISSDCHRDAMRRKIKDMIGSSKIEVIDLYEGLPIGPYNKPNPIKFFPKKYPSIGGSPVVSADWKPDKLEPLIDGSCLPVGIGLDTINRCNVSCLFCGFAQALRANQQKLAPLYVMSVPEFERLLDGIVLQRIILAGMYSEPLLNPNILRFLTLTVRHGGEFCIITNGTLISDHMAKAFVEEYMTKLSVSLHGTTPEIAEELMPGSSFKQVVENIQAVSRYKRRMNASRPFIDIQFVGTRSNIQQLPAMIDLAAGIGVSSVYVKDLGVNSFAANVKQGAWWHEQDLRNHPELLREEYAAAKERSIAKGIRLILEGAYQSIVQSSESSEVKNDASASRQHVPAAPNGGLPPGMTRLCIWPFEKLNLFKHCISPCCSQSYRDHPLPFGDPSRIPLAEIWNGDAYRNLRMALLTGIGLPEACRKCDSAPAVYPAQMRKEIESLVYGFQAPEKKADAVELTT